jgi:hypothetical protein
MKIGIQHDMNDLVRRLDVQQKQVPFAASLTINRTAQLVKEAEIKDMRDSFDRPVPYTLNSVFIEPSTKQNLTAKVWIKDDGGKGNAAADYLLPQIMGGERALKKFERALQLLLVLPKGMRIVPGNGAEMNAYGNMSQGQIKQILSYFNAAQLTSGYSANTTASRREKLRKGTKTQRGMEYFVGRPAGGRLPLGIWQRITQFARHGDSASKLIPIMIFVTNAQYRKLFRFDETAQQVIAREWSRQFEMAAKQAMATAK